MKVMVPYDGKAASEKALDAAVAQAKATGAEVHVVRAFPQKIEVISVEEIERGKSASQELDQLKSRLQAEGVSCVTALLTANVSHGENLVQYATDNAVDSILIGLRKFSKVGKMLFGSTAQYVILHAPCPVTSVKIS
jgi:nucleotide-binding universal stress UspA family protein